MQYFLTFLLLVNMGGEYLSDFSCLVDFLFLPRSKKEMSNEEKEMDTEVVVGLDEANQDGMIKLVAGMDGASFVLPQAYAAISSLVRNAMEGQDQNNNLYEIFFPDVNGTTLGYMVEYMNHHRGNPTEPPAKPLRSKDLAEQCADKWDYELICRVADQGLQFLYNLILVRPYIVFFSFGC